MNYFIDTHAHLYLSEFDNDRKEVVERAIQNGVTKIMLPNIDSSSIKPMHELAAAFPETCFAMMGLHPTSVKETHTEEMAIVEEALRNKAYKAIGEIGIDLYWDNTFLKEQLSVLTRQLDLALHYHLPTVIHARNSFPQIMEVMESYRGKGLKGIFHAFSGNLEIAQVLTEMGFKLGIGGVITYKKTDLPLIVREIPLKHLVLETDAPYLTPVPYRGKRNESSYIPNIGQVLQQLKNVPLDEVARVTTENAMELFFPAHGQ
jgi:TatD DNase family protein